MTQPSPLDTLASYIASALDRPLPPAVLEKTKHHVLDTIAAMVTGSRLKPGEAAINFVRSQGGTPEAAVVGSNVVTTAINAAMANGMLAHSDETDDSHAPSLTHPGCAVVPAALAVAERQKRQRGGAAARSGPRLRRRLAHRAAHGWHRRPWDARPRNPHHRADVRLGSSRVGPRETRPPRRPLCALLHGATGLGHHLVGPRLRAHREVVRVRRQRRAERGHFRALRGVGYDG